MVFNMTLVMKSKLGKSDGIHRFIVYRTLYFSQQASWPNKRTMTFVHEVVRQSRTIILLEIKKTRDTGLYVPLNWPSSAAVLSERLSYVRAIRESLTRNPTNSGKHEILN